MAMVIKALYNILTDEGNAKDGAYSHWPLTTAAWPGLLLSAVYVAFVFHFGPRYMKNRPAFKLKRVLLFYNLLQILLNLYIAVLSAYFVFYERVFDITCIEKLPSNHYYKHVEAILSYIYFVNKYMDYMDTVFFVLRKNHKQITFLHVYHHLLMANMGYIYIRIHGFGGHVLSVGVLNSLVHVFMYTYYLLSAQYPQSRDNMFWWKKNITRIQILQFVLLLVHNAWPLLFRTDCQYPKHWLYAATTNACVMLYLFCDFYRKAYSQKPKPTITKPTKKLH